MSKHTPGPWHVSEKGFSRKGLWSAPTVFATDDELRYIAVCACADFGNSVSATDNTANARLIAAAPELLEALESAVGVIENAHKIYCTCSIEGPCYLQLALDRSNAAIAKAKGEE